MFEAEQATLDRLRSRREILREWGEAYRSGRSTVEPLRIDIQRSRAVLDVREDGVLRYARVSGGEPDLTAWVVDRRFHFEHRSESWVLSTHHLLGDRPAPPINEPSAASPEQSRAALVELSNQSRPQPAHPASKAAVATYAEKYWRNYNAAYRRYNGAGGDCTNFVSQALRAGGWSDVTGWYRSPEHWWYTKSNQSWSWVNVGLWYEFAAVHSRRTSLIGDPRGLRAGDILQIDFTNNGSKDHSMVVSYYSGQPYLTYHTTDTYRRSLASLIADSPGARWLSHRT